VNVAEVKLLLLGKVDDSAWCTDNDLSARLDVFDLAFVGATANQSGHLGFAVTGGKGEVICYLNREFAGRNHYQSLGAEGWVGAKRLNQR